MQVYLKRIENGITNHDAGIALLTHIYKKPFEIKTGKNGKPYIADNLDYHFNISHSGEWLSLAIAENEVGIDIQKHEKNRTRVSERFFAPSERSLCYGSVNTFFDIWVQKEAFIKATGDGLSLGLDTFSVCEKQQGYDIVLLDAPPGYSLAVCEHTEKIIKIEKEILM